MAVQSLPFPAKVLEQLRGEKLFLMTSSTLAHCISKLGFTSFYFYSVLAFDYLFFRKVPQVFPYAYNELCLAVWLFLSLQRKKMHANATLIKWHHSTMCAASKVFADSAMKLWQPRDHVVVKRSRQCPPNAVSLSGVGTVRRLSSLASLDCESSFTKGQLKTRLVIEPW